MHESRIAALEANVVAPVDATSLSVILDIHRQWTGIVIAVNSGVMEWNKSTDGAVTSIMEPHEQLSSICNSVLVGDIPVNGFELFMLLYLWDELADYVDPPEPASGPPGHAIYPAP